MKVRFFCNSGANIHSCREEVIDTVKHLGLSDEEWDALTDEQKWDHANEWAQDRLEIGFEELQD